MLKNSGLALLLLFVLVLSVDAQWFEFRSVVPAAELDNPLRFHGPEKDIWTLFYINDAGDTLHYTREIEKTQIIVNKAVVHEFDGIAVPIISDLTNTGEFAFYWDGVQAYRDGVVTDLFDLEIGLEDLDTPSPAFVQGPGGADKSPLFLDSSGTAYFIGSTNDQVDRSLEHQFGRASVYTGPDSVEDRVFGDFFVEIGRSSGVINGWNVNENGDIGIGLEVIPKGERVLDWFVPADIDVQASLNNLGDATLASKTQFDGVAFEDSVTVRIDGEDTAYQIDGAIQAFINDERQVLITSGNFIPRRIEDVSLLDATTGEMNSLFLQEDMDRLKIRVFDFNRHNDIAMETIDGWFVVSPSDKPLPDLTFDGLVTGADIDRLATAIRDDRDEGLFDVTQDGTVDSNDFDFWVEQLAAVQPGDTNFDGQVDFEDFLVLSSNFDTMGGWEDGDFDGSGSIEFDDFLLLSTAYGTRSAPASMSVPEPTQAFWLTSIAIFVVLRHASRSRLRLSDGG